MSLGLATRGYQTGGSSAPPVTPPVPISTAEHFNPPVQGVADTVIVIPTAPNIVLMVAENIFKNLRVQQPSNVVLPSLYKRAYLIAYETDEIAVVKPKT